jgi:hypothetical protein
MKYTIAVSAIFLLVFIGCATPLTPRESGTLTDAEIGAATGAILGGIAGAPGRGSAIDAVVGAVTGALTGDAHELPSIKLRGIVFYSGQSFRV